MAKRKGKQVAIQLHDAEWERLQQIYREIDKANDTNMSAILREFLGLRKPAKVTRPGDLEYFNGECAVLVVLSGATADRGNLPISVTETPRVRTHKAERKSG